jgi:hypothetical protein
MYMRDSSRLKVTPQICKGKIHLHCTLAMAQRVKGRVRKWSWNIMVNSFHSLYIQIYLRSVHGVNYCRREEEAGLASASPRRSLKVRMTILSWCKNIEPFYPGDKQALPEATWEGNLSCGCPGKVLTAKGCFLKENLVVPRSTCSLNPWT